MISTKRWDGSVLFGSLLRGEWAGLLHSAMFLLMRRIRYIFVYINSGLGLNCTDNVFWMSFPMFFLCNAYGIEENYLVSFKIEHISPKFHCALNMLQDGVLDIRLLHWVFV